MNGSTDQREQNFFSIIPSESNISGKEIHFVINPFLERFKQKMGELGLNRVVEDLKSLQIPKELYYQTFGDPRNIRLGQYLLDSLSSSSFYSQLPSNIQDEINNEENQSQLKNLKMGDWVVLKVYIPFQIQKDSQREKENCAVPIYVFGRVNILEKLKDEVEQGEDNRFRITLGSNIFPVGYVLPRTINIELEDFDLNKLIKNITLPRSFNSDRIVLIGQIPIDMNNLTEEYEARFGFSEVYSILLQLLETEKIGFNFFIYSNTDPKISYHNTKVSLLEKVEQGQFKPSSLEDKKFIEFLQEEEKRKARERQQREENQEFLSLLESWGFVQQFASNIFRPYIEKFLNLIKPYLPFDTDEEKKTRFIEFILNKCLSESLDISFIRLEGASNRRSSFLFFSNFEKLLEDLKIDPNKRAEFFNEIKKLFSRFFHPDSSELGSGQELEELKTLFFQLGFHELEEIIKRMLKSDT